MVMLYKDPEGENIFDRGQTNTTLNAGLDESKLEDLELHCVELERRLGNYEVSYISIH